MKRASVRNQESGKERREALGTCWRDSARDCILEAKVCRDSSVNLMGHINKNDKIIKGCQDAVVRIRSSRRATLVDRFLFHYGTSLVLNSLVQT